MVGRSTAAPTCTASASCFTNCWSGACRFMPTIRSPSASCTSRSRCRSCRSIWQPLQPVLNRLLAKQPDDRLPERPAAGRRDRTDRTVDGQTANCRIWRIPTTAYRREVPGGIAVVRAAHDHAVTGAAHDDAAAGTAQHEHTVACAANEHAIATDAARRAEHRPDGRIRGGSSAGDRPVAPSEGGRSEAARTTPPPASSCRSCWCCCLQAARPAPGSIRIGCARCCRAPN